MSEKTNQPESELSLSEIQKEALNVLIKFDYLCREHNWSYFITYGTLIGAIRHKGFIPWDDDVDVQMPRKDFEEFSCWCVQNSEALKPYKLCSRETVKNYPYGIPRFSNMNFKYLTTEKGILPFEIGVFIDIYPFDNYCSNLKDGSRLQKKIARINWLVPIFITGKCEGSFIRKIVKQIVHIFLRITKPIDYPKLANKEIMKIIEKNTNDNDIFIGCPAWTAGCCQFKKEWLSERIEVQFEGHNFFAPAGYDEFLRRLYGNYMELPPENERIPYHEYKIYERS